MFEVDVKHVTDEGREGGKEGREGGPARVWGSDYIIVSIIIPISPIFTLHNSFHFNSLFRYIYIS